MPNYQDSNLLANVFIEFVTSKLNKLDHKGGLCVFYIRMDLVNKKNLEIYGFELILQSIKKITQQIIDATQDIECSTCFLAMDELILVTRSSYENLCKKIFELCDQFHITQDEYIKIPIYLGYQQVTEEVREPLKLFRNLLVNEVDQYKSTSQELLNSKIKNTSYFREQILEKNMIFMYQPVFNLLSNQIEYYECLMRIKSDGQFKSVADFICSAEEFELGPLIDRAAFDLLKKTIHDYPHTKFSFNLTASIIENKGLTDEIITFFKDKSIAQRVLVEITETSKLTSFEEAMKFIKQLRQNNVQFVIDDFGSGYTSFHQLNKLEIDVVKIDGSFVQDILVNKVSQNFVKAVVNICKEKNIKIVCEFVETEEVCQYLNNLGVQYMQGYYFGQPSTNIFR